MLKITISKNVNGYSRINDVDVANMTANISDNGLVTINKNVYNETLYAANKAEVQADMLEFEEKVYAMQASDSTNDTTTTTE